MAGPASAISTWCSFVEELAAQCGVSGRIVVEGNMGAISAIMEYGTEAQKRLAADHVLSGDKLAICITEPDAGSAATQMTTRADRRGNTWVLNGTKHWITGGGVSRLHLVFARAFDEDGTELGIGGFLAIRDETPGLVTGEREPTMGLRGIPETEVHFRDMVVHEDMVVMPPSGFKRGFAELMNAYNAQRVGAGTVAMGLAKGAYERALAFAGEREQFGRPIAEFQGLQWMLADMSVQTEAGRALLYKAAASAGTNGSPFPDPTLAAQAKIFASEMAIKVTTDALQVFGARGYSRSIRWSASNGMPGCSRSGEGPRRSCGPSWPRAFSAANCPRPVMVSPRSRLKNRRVPTVSRPRNDTGRQPGSSTTTETPPRPCEPPISSPAGSTRRGCAMPSAFPAGRC